MKYIGVIQARCGSTRFPNKVLMDFSGKPSLQWTIERAQKSEYLEEVVVVTSINRENLPIVKLCNTLGVRVFLGSEDDVLDRFYQFAKLVRPEYIVRITGDCPLYDSQLLDLAIKDLNNESDYLAQKQPETFPDGLDIEVIKFQALEKAWKDAVLKSDREHVTQYIRNHPKVFKLQWINCPLGNYGNERWTFDEKKDYEFLKKIYSHFSKMNVMYPNTQEIITYLDQNPSVRLINRDINRDEGLEKSINDEKVYSKGE